MLHTICASWCLVCFLQLAPRRNGTWMLLRPLSNSYNLSSAIWICLCSGFYSLFSSMFYVVFSTVGKVELPLWQCGCAMPCVEYEFWGFDCSFLHNKKKQSMPIYVCRWLAHCQRCVAIRMIACGWTMWSRVLCTSTRIRIGLHAFACHSLPRDGWILPYRHGPCGSISFAEDR